MKLWVAVFSVAVIGGAILTACMFSLQGGFLRVIFLNIGQGDAILIEAPTGERVLVDGGPDDSVLVEIGRVMPFFERRIDAIVLTHPHADHVNGLVAVLRRYDVRQVVLTGVSYHEAAYEAFLEMATAKDVELIFVNGDFDLRLGGVVIDVLYPFDSIEGEKFANINNSSIVMRLLYGGFSLFLAGDGEVEVEEELVSAGYDLSSDVMKASHHGSKTANSLDLISRLDADAVVISCGVDNSFNHPHIEAMRNFRMENLEIFRTDIDGAVEIVSDGKSYSIKDYSETRLMSAPSD